MWPCMEGVSRQGAHECGRVWRAQADKELMNVAVYGGRKQTHLENRMLHACRYSFVFRSTHTVNVMVIFTSISSIRRRVRRTVT